MFVKLTNKIKATMNIFKGIKRKLTALCQLVVPPSTLLDGSNPVPFLHQPPEDHWLFKPFVYSAGTKIPDEFPKLRILAPRALYEEQVVAAVRWALRSSTDCGKDKNLNPDGLVRDVVYALCGPVRGEVDVSKPTSQEAP